MCTCMLGGTVPYGSLAGMALYLPVHDLGQRWKPTRVVQLGGGGLLEYAAGRVGASG